MAFDYEVARAAQRKYIEQSASNRVDAENQRRLADLAEQMRDDEAHKEHLERAAFHEEQRARFDALERDMQRQMEVAHASEMRQREADERIAAEEDDQQRQAEAAERDREQALERMAERERMEELQRAVSEQETLRQRQEADRQADELARQEAERERQRQEADRLLQDANERAAQRKRDRGRDDDDRGR